MQQPKKTYSKKDHISHVLDRSDMYVGSKRLKETEEYIAIKDDSETGSFKIIKKNIKWSPAILRIFIEVLSNAIDNVERSKKTKTPCTSIKVVINKETSETSVWNDGDIIPIEMNEKEGIYNHSLIFGHLMAGSNYDDTEERLIAGRFGLGGKLANIFSTKFIVKGLDPDNKKVLEQTWTNNMRNTTPPEITTTKLKTGFTKITYFPEFKHFGVSGYTDDIISLYTKFVIDAAMLTKIKVYINDELIPVNNLSSYYKLYESSTDESLLIKNANSEVLITPSSCTNEFQTISFVNGVYTRMGGQHVDAFAEAIFRPLVEKFNKKGRPPVNIKDIKQFFRLFVNSTVVNPEFASQDKEKLESPKIDASIKPSEINKILKWSVVNDIEDMIKIKEMGVLKKSEKKKKSYTKVEGLDNANLAGGKYSHLCSLILCEGLSAATFGVAGIQKGIDGVCGRDYYGILSLTGKLLNCRNSNPTVISKNKVITNLIQALGLRHDVDYTIDENYKTLSYGKVILLTDADCFVDDTPLLIKRDNKVSIIQIKNLFDDNLNIDTQMIDNIEVWSDTQWVPINAIRRKINDKRILTINTYSGLVRCTEDHTFLLENHKEIKAKDIKIGDKLLRNRRLNDIPDVNTDIENELQFCSIYIQPKTDYFNISEEEAWFWGVFFANGSCDSVYYISNSKYEKLEKALKIIKNIYDCNLKIEENNQKVFKLVLNDIENFISNIEDRFYTSDKLKKVPDEILNNNSKIQESFLKGCYDGDDFSSQEDSAKFEIPGQIGAQGLCYIAERLGYSYDIDENVKNNIFNINISRRFYPGTVKYIYETDYSDRFIYDIQTSTGKINTGIGNMVQRQCDGLHISGLIMNFIHALFPTLLQRREPFILSMLTPIVRVFNPKGDLLFYDENKYKEFEKVQDKPFKSKYYKGLGTTKPEDVQDIFGLKMVNYTSDEKLNDMMDKTFHKNFTNERKTWMENYEPSNTFSLDDQGNRINMHISSYLDTELIKFSINDCKRSIPCLFDGLKESQRKIVFAIKKRNLTYNKQSLKVAQFGGYVAEHTNYHHGEQNLYDTIIRMAQDFVGSNNIPLLYRDGMFGTRLHPSGSDAASPRYIFTKMEKLTPLIFRPEDDVLLDYIVEEGDSIEPTFYVPIIPMILVNGASGIGSGWSTNINSYNPLDIIGAVKTWIENDGEVILEDPDDLSVISLLPELTPWYRGFTGEIENCGENKYVTRGIITPDVKGKLKVKELPIGMATDKFKEYLEDLVVNKNIKNMSNNSTPTVVDFTITPTEDFRCNVDNLKMYTYLNTTNMVLFNEKDQLKKYTIDQIIDEFCKMRYSYYVKRKKHILNSLEKEMSFLSNKMRFIREIIEEKLVIKNIDKNIIIAEMEKRGYDKKKRNGDVGEGDSEVVESDNGNYDYLLKMEMQSLTLNKVKQLGEDIATCQKKIDYTKSVSENRMWLNDLEELEKEYMKWLDEMNKIGKKKTNTSKK